MKVGDLVKLKFRGNGHPHIGLIVFVRKTPKFGWATLSAKVLWDDQRWPITDWQLEELVVINESV